MAQGRGYMDIITCPVCGKDFIKAPKNTYKIKINGKTVHIDKYSCYVQAKAEQSKGYDIGGGCL